MVEIFWVVACAECRAFWAEEVGPARCTEPGHLHQRHEVHRHRTPVVLPDGTEIVAVSFGGDDPYRRDRPPGFGLYFDDRWQPPWPHAHVDWPDFGVPEDGALLSDALRDLLTRARGGERVEIGCLGGHGRTGTALACLTVLAGVDPAVAVEWVRTNYCAMAVETDDQVALVAQFTT